MNINDLKDYKMMVEKIEKTSAKKGISYQDPKNNQNKKDDKKDESLDFDKMLKEEIKKLK